MTATQIPDRLAALSAIAEGRLALRTGRVRSLRERIGLTQAEFANAVGVTSACVSRWESGQRRPRGNAAERLLIVVQLLEKTSRESVAAEAEAPR